jgi:hypothetical protein
MLMPPDSTEPIDLKCAGLKATSPRMRVLKVFRAGNAAPKMFIASLLAQEADAGLSTMNRVLPPLNTTIPPMVSDEQLERIQSIFAARAVMRSIAVGNRRLQAAARPSQILELQRQGGQYYFLPIDPNTRHLPPVEGAFLFVILADDPGRIYCGVPESSIAAAADARFGIAGHTSLSYRKDVLFAGELFFERAELMSWTNGSGHYTPAASVRGLNLIPAVQRLLPDDRFTDYWNLTTAQARHHLQLRGYTWPN